MFGVSDEPDLDSSPIRDCFDNTAEGYLLKDVATFLSDYASKSGRSTFVLYFDGTRESALAIHACADATALRGGLKIVPFCSTEMMGLFNELFGGSGIDPHRMRPEFEKFPYVSASSIAEDMNGLLVSPISKTYGPLLRKYSKIGEGICDVFPFWDLPQLSIMSIANKIWWRDYPKFYEKIGMDEESVKEDEFSLSLDNKHSIVSSDSMPHQNKHWPYLLKSQKDNISHLHQREKKTRHKIMTNVPHPDLSRHQLSKLFGC